jgi:hypothetical protein
MNKSQRKALYDYLTSTGYVFNRERHKALKKLLTSPTDPTGTVEESESYDDDDKQILSPDEDEDKE